MQGLDEDREDRDRVIDFALEDCLRRHERGPSPVAPITGRLLSAALRQGHSCLDLKSISDPASDARGSRKLREDLLRSSLVTDGGSDFKPLVLDHERVYFHRYWEFECRIAREIRRRAGRCVPEASPSHLQRDLDALFPVGSDALQRDAARKGATRSLTIIAGGPGTGKTTTILRTLALIASQDPGSHPLNVALAAPTGKAANRMEESLRMGISSLPKGAELAARLTHPASTIHKLIGLNERSLAPQYDRSRPLPYHTVIIDEMSMVDLPLMARLLDAIHPEARLILLGDSHQLASVEVGSIFADILAATEQDLELRSCTVRLMKNYRFGEDSTVHRFCEALKAGNASAAIDVLNTPESSVTAQPAPLPLLPLALSNTHIFSNYSKAWAHADPADVLRQFSRARILCALHRGPYGAERFNEHTAQLLAQRNLISRRENLPYPKQPVIVTHNDYQLSVFNGDTGILAPASDDPGRLEACFPTLDGRVRKLPALRLPPHLPAYAMTIHRSQGSEFDRVLVVLPEPPNRCLTRELLYTAVSRARESAFIWGSTDAIRECLRKPASRASGLVDRLTRM